MRGGHLAVDAIFTTNDYRNLAAVTIVNSHACETVWQQQNIATHAHLPIFKSARLAPHPSIPQSALSTRT